MFLSFDFSQLVQLDSHRCTAPGLQQHHMVSATPDKTLKTAEHDDQGLCAAAAADTAAALCCCCCCQEEEEAEPAKDKDTEEEDSESDKEDDTTDG